MKSLREKFEDDYVAVSVPKDNQEGFRIRYVYYAPWHMWDLPEPKLRRKKRLLMSISVGSLLLFILTGIQNTDLNSYFAVALTGTLALGIHVFELFSMIQFQFAKYRTSRMTYTNINQVLNYAPLIRGLCLITAVAACLYYMQWTSIQLQIQMVFVAGGYLLSALSALFIFREYRQIPFRTEKNDVIKELEISQQP